MTRKLDLGLMKPGHSLLVDIGDVEDCPTCEEKTFTVTSIVRRINLPNRPYELGLHCFRCGEEGLRFVETIWKQREKKSSHA